MFVCHRPVAAAAAAFVLAGACAPKDAGGADASAGAEPARIVDAKVGVAVSADGAGGYQFAYSGDYSDAEGNLDFSKGDADGDRVNISFTIGAGSVDGLKFMARGEDAMWIGDKKVVGDGSPEGPYQGRQFTNFTTAADGMSLSVMNANDDAMVYRYALRFDLNGETIADDPDLKNGDSGGN